jgi:DNA-binding NtrC family response regulator
MEGSMPASIVVVHDDPKFREYIVTVLQAAGYDTKAFAGSMAALDVLDEATTRIELLITSVLFPEGTPNGISLARMARMKKPGVRILFTAREENREHTGGIGEFLAVPVSGPELVATVERMLAAGVG